MKGFRLLRADEIECRVALAKATGVSLLLYKDARADMNILDETVGMFYWQNSYSRENKNCTVSIYDKEKKEWVSKEDTGTESNTEKEKGLASDSFKRACFRWGIGRELYSSPFIWIPASACELKANSKGDGYTTYDKFRVTSIGYDEAENINQLTIINEKTGQVVYELGKAQKKIEAAKISETHLRALLGLLADEGIPAKFVCQGYRVKELSELTEEQHTQIAKNIAKIKKSYEGKAF